MKTISCIMFMFFALNGFTQTTKAKTTATSSNTKAIADTGKNSLEKAVDVFLQDPELKNASFSFVARDTKTNTIIAEHNADMSLVPASTMKLVTTSAAMEILGGGYKFKTRLEYSGYIDTNCVLHGDIYIRGGGDPSLGSRFFKEHYYEPDFLAEWAHTIRNMGIDSVDGRIVGDADIYGNDPTPTTWIYGDLGNYYGAPPNGLTIFDNTCYFEFESGENNGDSTQIVCIEPEIPGMEIVNMVKSANTNDDNSTIIGPPYRFNRYIRGTIPKNKENYEIKGSIPDPALQTAFELQMALHNINIGVRNGFTTTKELREQNALCDLTRIEFYTQYSPAVSSIIYWINMNSVNLFAEHLCIQIGLTKYGSASTASGCGAITDFWKKRINTDGLFMYDGCGLSRHNAISANNLTDILVYMSKSKNATAFENTLPVAGKSGTLSNVGRKSIIAGNLKAKSGSMQRVKSYAGYVRTKSGKKLAFTMIINNFNCSIKSMMTKFEKLMVAMAAYNE